MQMVDGLKKDNVYPYFTELTSGQDTEVVMNGQKTVMIGSNNYLGLTSHPDVINAGIEALKKYGKCPIHRNSFIKNFVSNDDK